MNMEHGGLHNAETNEDFGIKIVNSKDLIPEIKDRVSPEIAEETHNSRSKTLELPTTFSETLTRGLSHEAFLKFLGDLKNQILVDIGAGDTPNGYYIATQADARAYIAVESYNFKELERVFREATKDISEEARKGGHLLIPLAIEREDMLEYLKRLPDHSVSILASGIDEFIIQDNEYLYELEVEIARVLHKEGAFINHASVFNPDLENPDIEWERLEDVLERDPVKYTYKKVKKGKR
jgi:hypothetical protein